MSKITPNMLIGEVLRMDKDTAPIFLNNGMHCLGCPSSQGESIGEACEVHGIDPDKLVKELNDFFEKKS